jgi:hypothetical protein
MAGFTINAVIRTVAYGYFTALEGVMDLQLLGCLALDEEEDSLLWLAATETESLYWL